MQTCQNCRRFQHGEIEVELGLRASEAMETGREEFVLRKKEERGILNSFTEEEHVSSGKGSDVRSDQLLRGRRRPVGCKLGRWAERSPQQKDHKLFG